MVMQIHYFDASWTLSNEIAFVVQQAVKKPAGSGGMEEKVIIAVGIRPIQFDRSLFTYSGNTLLVITGSILR